MFESGARYAKHTGRRLIDVGDREIRDRAALVPHRLKNGETVQRGLLRREQASGQPVALAFRMAEPMRGPNRQTTEHDEEDGVDARFHRKRQRTLWRQPEVCGGADAEHHRQGAGTAATPKCREEDGRKQGDERRHFGRYLLKPQPDKHRHADRRERNTEIPEPLADKNEGFACRSSPRYQIGHSYAPRKPS